MLTVFVGPTIYTVYILYYIYVFVCLCVWCAVLSSLVFDAVFLSLITVDHTRVVLRDGDPSEAGMDYINANIIMVT